MLEKDVIPSVMKYIRDVRRESCATEVKLARGASISFSALEEHQERALLLANTKAIYHKIGDGSGQQTPFDAFCLVGTPAYVAIVWARYKKHLTLIPIKKWIKEKEASTRKSITFERAKELSPPFSSPHIPEAVK